MPLPIDPWLVEIVVVARGSHTGAERRAISRDVERGRFERIGPGRYAEAAALDALTPEGRHIVTLRALDASSAAPVVLSHWSAAVLHGLPALRARIARPHITTEDDSLRHRTGVVGHRFALRDDEVTVVRGLRVTNLGRTVVDLAGAARLEEGVMAADAALAAGVPRAELEAAVELAGPRQASSRIDDTIAFAHPGGESAAESRTRVTAYRAGVEVPELQHRLTLDDGTDAFLDLFFRRADAALEVDGDSKYLSDRLAPNGAGAVVLAEKRREDQARTQVHGFGRIGWRQSGEVALLRPVLARIGVYPLRQRPGFDEWRAAARAARPRRPTRVG